MEKTSLVQTINNKIKELSELLKIAKSSGLTVNIDSLKSTNSQNHFILEIKEETVLFKSEI